MDNKEGRDDEGEGDGDERGAKVCDEGYLRAIEFWGFSGDFWAHR